MVIDFDLISHIGREIINTRKLLPGKEMPVAYTTFVSHLVNRLKQVQDVDDRMVKAHEALTELEAKHTEAVGEIEGVMARAQDDCPHLTWKEYYIEGSEVPLTTCKTCDKLLEDLDDF